MRRWLLTIPFLTLLTGLPALSAPDWDAVATALGKSGIALGDVYRVGLPRTDLKVSLDGVPLEPGFALGGWAAFAPMGADTMMMMGDLVLTDIEIAPVMAKLKSEGLDITSLHNHLLRDQPSTMFMHVRGMGDRVKLVTALHDALALSKTPFSALEANRTPERPAFDTGLLDRRIGVRGKANGDV